MESAVSQSLLAQVEQLAAALAEEEGFTLLSSFADRHGVSELRLVRTEDVWVGLVSFACDTTGRRAMRCELRASASSENNSGKQRIVDTLALATLDKAHSAQLATTLRKALVQANELISSLITEHAVVQMRIAQPDVPFAASLNRTA